MPTVIIDEKQNAAKVSTRGHIRTTTYKSDAVSRVSKTVVSGASDTEIKTVPTGSVYEITSVMIHSQAENYGGIKLYISGPGADETILEGYNNQYTGINEQFTGCTPIQIGAGSILMFENTTGSTSILAVGEVFPDDN
ncbi:MAG: hypothetical protein ABEK36_06255 [Candidatus Aenigmatarchaeota archaeon]